MRGERAKWRRMRGNKGQRETAYIEKTINILKFKANFKITKIKEHCA